MMQRELTTGSRTIPSDAKLLTVFNEENAKLKELLSGPMIDMSILRDVLGMTAGERQVLEKTSERSRGPLDEELREL